MFLDGAALGKRSTISNAIELGIITVLSLDQQLSVLIRSWWYINSVTETKFPDLKHSITRCLGYTTIWLDCSPLKCIPSLTDKIYMVRYEDLSLEPYETMDNILQFLGLEPSPLIDKFLESHTLIQRSGKGDRNIGASPSNPISLSLQLSLIKPFWTKGAGT